MPNDREVHQSEKRILIEILIEIESGLHEIVSVQVIAASRRHGRFRKEFANMIPGPWEQVAGAFSQGRQQLEADKIDWRYVEGVGLTGNMLLWKKGMLDGSRRSGGINRFLKIANSLLGSMAQVPGLQVLEIAKEYKENVEAAMVHGAR